VVDLFNPKPKSNNKVRHVSKLYEVGFIVDIVKEKEPKGY
jgi:hypothetical protein